MRWAVLVVMAVAGCGDADPMIGADAMPPELAPETCPAPPDVAVDFLGEACSEDPFPAVTTCHGGAGWCVAGTCRPQCNSTGCRHCDDGAYAITDRGACYCSPH